MVDRSMKVGANDLAASQEMRRSEVRPIWTSTLKIRGGGKGRQRLPTGLLWAKLRESCWA